LCIRMFLEKRTVLQLVKNFPALYGTKIVLSFPKELVAGSYSNGDYPSTHCHPATLSSILILSLVNPLLGNDLVDTFPLEPTHATIGSL
jgi:hypothetical protein